MTISSILGFRGATTTTISPTPSLGLGHRGPSFHNAQHRGDIWIHSDGWKGGKKGDSAALSALTLLAFLFFLHILQSCLQDMQDQNQPTIVVANGARREEVPTMVAVPIETPMPMPMPAPMQPMQTVQPGRTARSRRARSAPAEEQARHLQRVQQQHKAKHGDEGWQIVSVSSNKQRLRLKGQGPDTALSPRITSSASPLSAAQAEEADDDREQVVSITPAPPRPPPGSGERPAMVRVSTSSTSSEEEDDEDGVSEDASDASASAEAVANKQEEYDLRATTERIETATTTVPAASAVPVAVPAVAVPMAVLRPGVTFVPLASTFRGVFSMLAAPLLRMVQPAGGGGLGSGLGAALGAGLGQGLREGLRAAMCCDLVVCEAHRLGKITGAIGERVATTVSTVVRWVCGQSENELLDATRSGRAQGGDGCRRHIEQCERRAGRRTPVSTIAALLEAYVTGGRP
ncbi:Fibroblast growth factor receptor 2 [Frankliniella fusca]|uniref:Fibroblast growth factor receptor 2 n=1 Tax=Frankliniella fusca TaxID=407009 RepID=A0AAE1HGT5_9NEOP|nr:Fibroblast growth factor receptor 2 [Frankliniella fusca]